MGFWNILISKIPLLKSINSSCFYSLLIVKKPWTKLWKHRNLIDFLSETFKEQMFGNFQIMYWWYALNPGFTFSNLLLTFVNSLPLSCTFQLMITSLYQLLLNIYYSSLNCSDHKHLFCFTNFFYTHLKL